MKIEDVLREHEDELFASVSAKELLMDDPSEYLESLWYRKMIWDNLEPVRRTGRNADIIYEAVKRVWDGSGWLDIEKVISKFCTAVNEKNIRADELKLISTYMYTAWDPHQPFREQFFKAMPDED